MQRRTTISKITSEKKFNSSRSMRLLVIAVTLSVVVVCSAVNVEAQLAGKYDGVYSAPNGDPVDHVLYVSSAGGWYDPPGSGIGWIWNINTSGNSAKGLWLFGNSRGWFKWFTADNWETFTGTWGFTGGPSSGFWKGTRVTPGPIPVPPKPRPTQ